MNQPSLERLLEHYRRPRNYGVLSDATVSAKESNALCGDVVEVFLKIENDTISSISFVGKGCMLSQASASILTEFVRGMGLEDTIKLKKQDFMRLLGVELGPVRSKCAALPLNALKKALRSYLSGQDKKQ